MAAGPEATTAGRPLFDAVATRLTLFREGSPWTNNEVLRLGERVYGRPPPDFRSLEGEFGRTTSPLKAAR
jgi:hypothetical protein